MKLKYSIPYGKFGWFLSVLSLGALPVLADTVIVESRTGGLNLSSYLEGTGNWQNSSVKSSAGGTTAGIGSRFATADGATFSVTPTLGTAGGTYSVEVTHPPSSNIPTNLVVNITQTGGTGLPESTTVFNQASPNVWRSVGTIVLDPGQSAPTITFTKVAGSGGTGQRFYTDAIRFINQADPCLASLPQLITVNGPLAAGQTFVDVPAVTNTATAVTVYANGVQIGQKTSGIVNGVNRVVTTPLVKGQVITVTQSDASSVESCRPTTGPLVGGGANPSVRIALSIRQDTTLTGPAGTSGSSASTVLKFLGGSNVVAGFGTAPAGAKVFQPGTEWQTVSFLRGPDPTNSTDLTYTWAGTDANNRLQGNFGILDAIAIAIDGTDSGPYAIYIDNLMNGDTLIQDFESANAGAAAVQFNQPSFSSTTSPYLLSQTPGAISPNVSVVTNITADTGGQSLFVSWQFKDTAIGDWLRLVGQGSGTPNAQVDLSLPISFRMLLLPVGQVPTPTPPVIFTSPQDQTVLQGGNATFTVRVRGAGPLSYQWRFDGEPIAGATSASLLLTNVQPDYAGNYSVVVMNELGSATSGSALLTVNALVSSDTMMPLWSLAPGSRPYLANNNNQRGIAYHPVSGNLLVVSRSGSNAVHVLDGNTGAYVRTLNMTLFDGSPISGGTLALNMIGVTPDGLVYAGNLTENGTVDPFRLYVWIDDSAEAVPSLAWSGDPGRGVTNRWGDTFAVRLAGDHQIMIGSRSGTMVSVLFPDFSVDSIPAVLDVPGAAPGNFGLGLAFGEGDTFWGKSSGSNTPLVRVEFNTDILSSYIAQSFSQYPNMTALGVDPANHLLAGIMVETPDNLRLFDISDLGSAPVHVDTEFFPTDNASANGTGSVTFGPERVYALASNNGLIAMQLRPRIRATRNGNSLVLSWSGPYVLQAAPAASGTFENVPGATSPHTVDTSYGTQFFRLRN